MTLGKGKNIKIGIITTIKRRYYSKENGWDGSASLKIRSRLNTQEKRDPKNTVHTIFNLSSMVSHHLSGSSYLRMAASGEASNSIAALLPSRRAGVRR
jgi:hypothetical protein